VQPGRWSPPPVDPAEVVGLEVVNEEEDQRMLKLLRQQVCEGGRVGCLSAWLAGGCLVRVWQGRAQFTLSCQLLQPTVGCSWQVLGQTYWDPS
jgi:hypothetical protein